MGHGEVLVLYIAIFQRRNPRPTHAFVKNKHAKGAAQDGSMEVLILPIAIFQRHFF